MSAVRIVLSGAAGRVGQAMRAGLPEHDGFEVVGGIVRATSDQDRRSLLRDADVLVDFSTSEAAPDLLLQAAAAGVRPISGTTGLATSALDVLDTALRERGIAGVWASNFAVGAALMVHFSRIAARYMDGAEIIEMHHDRKADAPSGTAVSTARAIRSSAGHDLPDPAVSRWTLEGSRGAVEGGVRIHSVRLPGLVAHQEVLFGAQGQLLTIRHDALGRDLYVPGVALAIRAAMLPGAVGLVRGLDTVMGLTA